ncbi:hypothetical protein RRG08_064989 [Elysia crispata]|uniref:Uncharacterized protein n=1 Tax=Elysia crispata TaxID=231223 RepID=A0AAE1CUU7_9GAST|nr:hypothetical protein RRG08_064989 [Elysia crispata]
MKLHAYCRFNLAFNRFETCPRVSCAKSIGSSSTCHAIKVKYDSGLGQRWRLLSLCLSTSPLHDCDLVYDAIDPATDVELQVAIETDGRLNM